MDTEESEREEEGGEQIEQEEAWVVDTTGSGDGEETGEGIDGEESTKAGEDKEETGDVEETEGHDEEKSAGEQEDVEGRIGRDDDGIAEDEEEIGEKEEKGDSGEKNREQEEEKEAEIVLLDDITTDERESPTDERAARRQYRRNRRLEEEAVADGAKGLRQSDTEDAGDADPQAQETLADEGDISSEALETRYEAERKRKGKHAAKPQKKKPRQAATTVVINEATPETIRVPFAHPTDEDREQENPQTKEGAFEKMEVLVTKRLLEVMVKFEDLKLQRACDGRAANGKLAKSGKKLCLSDLADLGVEKKFTSYFKSIGFEWLLNHCEEEVPVALAKEFFTSFKFKATTNLDADSISFRLFNEEMEMSIREWSLRIGLLTPEEDEEGTWNEREIDAPKNTEGFDAEEA